MYYKNIAEAEKVNTPSCAYACARAQLGNPAAGLPSSSSSSEITRAGAGACVTALRDSWEEIYAQMFGHEPSVWDRRDAAFYVERGMDASLIALALRDTAAAPRPSWTYTVAILRRCLTEGCLTLEAWDRRKQLHAEARPQRRKVAAQDYSQRSYTGAELDRLFETL